MSYVRYSAVAGSFYEFDPNELRSRIEWCFLHRVGPGRLPKSKVLSHDVVGVLSPHAGYVYSGPIAAHSYLEIYENKENAENFVIIGPNHTGYGPLISVMDSGSWETPLGRVEINGELAGEILRLFRLAQPDRTAHLYEHSVEVQLPFLQYLFGNNFRFVPIVMMDQSLDSAVKLGEAIAEAVASLGLDKSTVIIASSDLTHYESYESAYRKDSHIAKAIEAMDERKMYEYIRRYRVSMCGPGPAASMMVASKRLGATGAKILKYGTSGDTSGDKNLVVGYLSAVLFK